MSEFTMLHDLSRFSAGFLSLSESQTCGLHNQHRTKLSDSLTLTEASLADGDTVLLVALQPCEIYIQGVDQRMHTITVPASEPDVCRRFSIMHTCVCVCFLLLHCDNHIIGV